MTPDTLQPAFPGFDLPEQNWFRLPNSWTDITRDITSLGELKVVEYVLRHTWGYREYGLAKRISTDEFMHGRRHKDGSRMDRGTGLSKQSVIDGLRKAASHGYLVEEIDDSDKGRIKKYYSLRMKPGTAAVSQPSDESEPPGSLPSGSDENLDPDVRNLDRGVKNLDTMGQESRPRSEKDALDRHRTVTVNGQAAVKIAAGKRAARHDEHPVTRLARLNQPPHQTELLARDIAEELGDSDSLPFYLLVADRVPEHTIRRHLSEIRLNGAKHPAKLFNYRIRRYVEDRLAATQTRDIARFKKRWTNYHSAGST